MSVVDSKITELARKSDWLSAYYDLRADGLHWKKAAFVAWHIAPKSTREPKTMGELATLLNYASDQVFYKWRSQDWFKDLQVDTMRELIFLDNLADVDRRTIDEATTLGGRDGVAARKQFYDELRASRPDAETSDEAGDWWGAVDGE